jgi:hypothetical protein
MRGPINAWAANAEFNGVELHEKVLLPFYERFLKGKDTEWEQRPAGRVLRPRRQRVQNRGHLAACRV